MRAAHLTRRPVPGRLRLARCWPRPRNAPAYVGQRPASMRRCGGRDPRLSSAHRACWSAVATRPSGRRRPWAAWAMPRSTLRANAVKVVLPDLNYNGSSSTVPAGDKLLAPAPLVEGALGLYKGMSERAARPGSSGLGAAASHRPDRQPHASTAGPANRQHRPGPGLRRPDWALRGVGPLPARVGQRHAARYSPASPMVTLPPGDRYSYGVDLHATNLRLIASKQVLMLDLAAGLGWDKYTGDAIIQFAIRSPVRLSPTCRWS